MSIPTGFKGQISFFLSNSCGEPRMIIIDHRKDGTCWADAIDGYVRISDPIEVDAPFFDVRAKQVEALEAEIEKEKQASFNRIQKILGQIKELQAIEAPKP